MLGRRSVITFGIIRKLPVNRICCSLRYTKVSRLPSGRDHFPSIVAAGWLFVAGIVLFSGSLYVLALSRITLFGAVTPIGGLAFLVGWACLIAAAVVLAGAPIRPL